MSGGGPMEISTLGYKVIDNIVCTALLDMQNILRGVNPQKPLLETKKPQEKKLQEKEVEDPSEKISPPDSPRKKSLEALSPDHCLASLKSSDSYTTCFSIEPTEEGKLAFKSNVSFTDCEIVHKLKLCGLLDKKTMRGSLKLNGKEFRM